jgi:hypothetical protein
MAIPANKRVMNKSDLSGLIVIKKPWKWYSMAVILEVRSESAD